MAAIVLSKLGAASAAAMRSISARFSAMAASSAGLMSVALKCPNGGTPPHGPVYGASRGFIAELASFDPVPERSEFGELVSHPASANSRSGLRAVARRWKVMLHVE